MTRLISMTAFMLLLATPALAHTRHHYRHHRQHITRHHRHDSEMAAHESNPDSQGGDSASRPKRISGLLEFAGEVFSFVSGGAGWSIPFGDWEITGSDGVGSWGSRHGAIGIAGGEIYDPVLHRKREGIELHAGRYATEGCVAIEPKRWPEFKRKLLAFGEASLHIGRDGAAIVPAKVASPVTWGFVC